MLALCLVLIPVAFAISAPLCAALVALGHRLRTFDGGGVAGQVKEAPRRVPNTGGIAIFVAIAGPLAAVVVLAAFMPQVFPTTALGTLSYVTQKAELAAVLLASLLLLHVVGVIDDRKPMKAWPKLILQILPAIAVPLWTDTRLLTLLDAHVGGPWLSILITVAWFIVVTNAINFLDNMDGLSAGLSAIAAGSMLVITLEKRQWLIAGCLALLIGACLGFLLYNAPRRSGAKLFMGDSGSLVLGFVLAFASVRITYFDPATPQGSHAHAVLMPLVVLAVPIYDFTVITLVRLWNGKSPLVGDLNHASHRLVRRGLSRAHAVYTLWGCGVLTGAAGYALTRSEPLVAAAIGLGVLVLLAILATLEYASRGSMSPTMPGTRSLGGGA
ncbi:MAG: undecaprenyl/decaprenyl-phosphate alpha-N-acetylglucosaminyl 1-phosphate transferase [Phycisphaerales bacterium]|nr:undecaprenyl/decaprenyl-phosphate alpha-N-acetylglucosaminyl 1-phosphate transferase [Phycisphaerales bacterium]